MKANVRLANASRLFEKDLELCAVPHVGDYVTDGVYELRCDMVLIGSLSVLLSCLAGTRDIPEQDLLDAGWTRLV